MTDAGRSRIDAAVGALLAREECLADAAAAGGKLMKEPEKTRMVVERLGDQAREHCEALKLYIGAGPEPEALHSSSSAAMNTPERSRLESASLVLVELFEQVNGLAIRYAELFAMAMRRFEPPLRDLAPRHLREHTEAARAIATVLPQAVASELAAAGLSCLCPCPMCCLGVCGCVAGATAVAAAAWREPEPEPGRQPGYLLQAPRPGSQLSALGIPGGAYLLSVNGERVPEHSAQGVQAAIKACPPGEEVRLTIAADGESREVLVRRVDTETG